MNPLAGPRALVWGCLLGLACWAILAAVWITVTAWSR